MYIHDMVSPDASEKLKLAKADIQTFVAYQIEGNAPTAARSRYGAEHVTSVWNMDLLWVVGEPAMKRDRKRRHLSDPLLGYFVLLATVSVFFLVALLILRNWTIRVGFLVFSQDESRF